MDAYVKRIETPPAGEHEKRARLAIEAANLGAWDLDPRTNTLVWDARARALAGLDADDAVDFETLFRTIHPDDKARVRQQIERALDPASGGDYVTEYRSTGHRDGERWLLVRGKVFFDEHGAPLRFIGVVMDISQQKRDEEALKRMTEELKRSNKELEQYASILAHDLKEPLRMVSSFLSLISHRGLVTSEEGKEFLRYAVGGTLKMKALIDALYRYSRVSRVPPSFTVVDSEKIVRDVLVTLRPCIDESRAKISHGPLPFVRGDETLLSQVFQNLICNALTYRREVSPEIDLSAERKGDEWIFAVKDNGLGFPQEEVDRIFILFQRLHAANEYRGIGAGLAICKRVVERHGGRIWADSRPGQGSTFYFTLPV